MIKKIIRATFDFDFTLFCAGASGVFAILTLVHLAMADVHNAIFSGLCAAVCVVATLYGRKLIKTAMASYIEECRGEHAANLREGE